MYGRLKRYSSISSLDTMTEHRESFADKLSRMAEEKQKLSRRKKKPHHGQSSLLRATIMEYGIYDKEVDAYKTQFTQMFDFIDSWKRPNSAGDNNNMINHDRMPRDNMNGKPPDSITNQKLNGNNVHLQLEAMPMKPYGRDLSLEEELDFRLQRMTSIANDLKATVNKEKDRRSMLLNEVSDCKERSLQVLNDLTLHFHRETELLQHRLLEMDSAIDDLEQEKHSMKVAYEEMVQHANKTVEAMEQDLLTAETRSKVLEEEITAVQSSYASMEEEHSVFRKEAKELQDTVTDLKIKVETLENQLQASELSKKHYESLLDMSLDKLRLLEYGEITPRKNLLRLRQKRAILQITSTSKSKQQQQQQQPHQQPPTFSGATLVPPAMFPRRSKSDESHEYRTQEVPITLKPRLPSDSTSIASYETGSEASGGALDTSRFTCDDRISVSTTTCTLSRTSTLLPGMTLPSPKTASRKKTKKKTFFAKAFQRKNQPSSENTPAAGNAPASGNNTVLLEGLPTIRDGGKGSQTSLTGLNSSTETENTAFVKSFDASLLSPNEYSADTQDCLLQQGRSHSVDALDSYTFLTQDCARGVEEDRNTKRTKKVQRTTSFAAIRKNGLTAFAKEVEKRFRKKRRSKTADGTEILQAKEDYERLQKPGMASKES